MRITGFHNLIFCLGLLLFNWPILSILNSRNPVYFFAYLYVLWIVIIGLVFFTRKKPDKGTISSEGKQDV